MKGPRVPPTALWAEGLHREKSLGLGSVEHRGNNLELKASQGKGETNVEEARMPAGRDKEEGEVLIREESQKKRRGPEGTGLGAWRRDGGPGRMAVTNWVEIPPEGEGARKRENQERLGTR